MKIISSLMIVLLLSSCDSLKHKKQIPNKLPEKSTAQIGEYVTSAYQDSKGNLWFGTLQKGIAKYDWNQLSYITKKDGLPSDRVIGILEDKNGIYWFETGNGLSKFDGKNFTNYVVSDDYSSNTLSKIFIDSRDTFWIGTWGGVYTFNGTSFKYFPIPYPKIKTAINPDTKNWVTDIEEDAEGNIWFARDGYGACKYDGKSFTHFLKKDGLHANTVTEIEFDKNGDAWFGTRVAETDNPDPTKRNGSGGINKLENDQIISFPEIEAFNTGNVYTIFKDNSGFLWIATTSNGVYKYDGHDFIKYEIPISIMGMTNDKKGNLWLSGAGGLYRINEDGDISNITIHGPWK